MKFKINYDMHPDFDEAKQNIYSPEDDYYCDKTLLNKRIVGVERNELGELIIEVE